MFRYGDLTYFNKLPLNLGIKFIRKCYFEQSKREHWEAWVSAYPHMEKKDFVSFDKFFNDTFDPEPPKRKSKEEMMANAEGILASLQKGSES
jgi:hypothetical protein